VPEATSWSLAVYDVNGRLVKRFNGSTGGPRFVTIEWDGTNQNGLPVASGIYLYRVNAGKFTAVKKMILLK
jgi:flagellar hook assembly protein FlgD